MLIKELLMAKKTKKKKIECAIHYDLHHNGLYRHKVEKDKKKYNRKKKHKEYYDT